MMLRTALTRAVALLTPAVLSACSSTSDVTPSAAADSGADSGGGGAAGGPHGGGDGAAALGLPDAASPVDARGEDADGGVADAPPVTSTGLKWHPGHYVQYRQANGTNCGTDCDAARHAGWANFLNEPNVKGVMVWISWKYLEGDKQGDYAAGMSWLKNTVSFIKATYPGKYMMLLVYTSDWGHGVDDSAQRGAFPAYFVDAGCPAIEGGTNSLVFKMHDPTCRGYLKSLLAAYGAAFDSEPSLEAVRIDQETDYGYNVPGGQGWDAQAIDSGWQEVALAARTAFPTTNIFIPLNWPEVATAAQQEALVAYYKSIRVSVGSPDTLPTGLAYDCPDTYNLPCVITGNAGPTTSGHDYCGEVGAMQALETSELGYNSVPPYGGITAAQVLKSWNDDYCASHGIWDYNEEIGNPNQRWSGVDGELATINANPTLTHSAKPAGY